MMGDLLMDLIASVGKLMLLCAFILHFAIKMRITVQPKLLYTVVRKPSKNENKLILMTLALFLFGLLFTFAPFYFS